MSKCIKTLFTRFSNYSYNIIYVFIIDPFVQYLSHARFSTELNYHLFKVPQLGQIFDNLLGGGLEYT